MTRFLYPFVPHIIAVLALFVAFGQWQKLNEARELLASAKQTNEVLVERVVREAEAAQDWRELNAELEETVETFNCSPSLDRALDRLRERRERTD